MTNPIQAQLEVLYDDTKGYQYNLRLRDDEKVNLRKMHCFVEESLERVRTCKDFPEFLIDLDGDLRALWQYGHPHYFRISTKNTSNFRNEQDALVIRSILLPSHNHITYLRSLIVDNKSKLESVTKSLSLENRPVF